MSPQEPPGPPPALLEAAQGGLRPLLDLVQARVAQAEADLAHALRWGWRPGSTAVRWYFRSGASWEGLRFWLDTPSEDFRGVYRTVHPEPLDLSSPGVEKMLHDAMDRLGAETAEGYDFNPRQPFAAHLPVWRGPSPGVKP